MAKQKVKFREGLNENQIKKVVKNAISTSIPVVMKDVVSDIESIFNDAITEYYNYPTRMYIRHGQSEPYTRSGENLFNAICVNYQRNGSMHLIDMDLDPSKLEPYDDDRINVRSVIFGKKVYKNIPGESREAVLSMITSGYRKRISGAPGKALWALPAFDSKYFKLNGINLNEIQDEIRDQFEDTVTTVIAKNVFNMIRGDLFE